MLNRRLLRVKVLQALYAYTQSSGSDVNKAERELFLSIERVYELYLYLLLLPGELVRYASLKLEDSKNKMFPTEEDLKTTNHFIGNRLIAMLEDQPALELAAEKRKISWSADRELIGRIFRKMRESSAYKDYLITGQSSFEDDKKFLLFLMKNIIFKFDLIEQAFQERSIYWNFDEFDYACMMVRNTVKKLEEGDAASFTLTPIYKDEEDDKLFVKKLFRETIASNKESEKLIAEKTKNWEVERIAVLDIIMMKMAITELIHFKSIPVKVTLNEYIEISKFFSSPKSKTFINGVLDKIIPDLKEQKKIVKTGRGLME